MENKIKVGMIGVGFHAKNVLLPALMCVSRLELVCACTAHAETAAEIESAYRLKCYTGYEPMLKDADIEGVLVLGGNHEQEVLACLAAGKHVFCETPGIRTYAGAEKISELRDKTNKVVMIGRCLRFAPIYRRMRAILEQWRREYPSERMFNVSYYPAIEHFYDLLMFLNGPIKQLFSFGASGQKIITLKFVNGDIGVIAVSSFNNLTPEYEKVEITGSGGMLRAVNGNRLIFHPTTEKLNVGNPEFDFDLAHFEGNLANFSFPYAGMRQLIMRGYVPELEDFTACISEGRKSSSSIENALKIIAVNNAVAESEKNNSWTDVLQVL
jgi:predicted dehydrogenase